MQWAAEGKYSFYAVDCPRGIKFFFQALYMDMIAEL